MPHQHPRSSEPSQHHPRPHLDRRAAVLGTAVLVAAALTSPLLAGSSSASAPALTSSPRIHDITGATHLSPYAGRTVSDVPGVVTAVRVSGSSRGFWFQDTHPDHDTRTSEGLFVFTGSKTPAVAVGDAVTVGGEVAEYYPGGKSTGVLPLTELEHASATVISTGNRLPAPVRINAGSIPTAWAPRPGGDGDISGLTLRPRRYALGYLSSLAGERVEVRNVRVVGPTDPYGELWITTKPGQARTPRGGTLYTSYAQHDSGRLEVTSLLDKHQSPVPEANTGDELRGATIGPLDYSAYGGYEIAATRLGRRVDRHLKQTVVKPGPSDQLSVATYNVENLSPKDTAAKFAALAQGVVHNLASPDIVALEEIQDDDGPTDDGVVDAAKTLTEFTDAIAAAGGPHYAWREIDPANDQDGGQPGGNIRNVFLYNPQRVSFVDVPGGDASTPVEVTGHGASTGLSVSPGRIAPADSAWNSSRKPLVGEFRFRGHPVFVVGNHFDAKLGDQPDFGRFQPPAQGSLAQREAQATLVNGFVSKLEAADAKANVVVLGDLNDYQFSPAMADLTHGGVLRDLIMTLPRDQRYTYVYDGQSEVLDHIMLSPSVRRFSYQVVHLNSEFANQVSDHDPQVVRLTPR